jgi:hypothetical protein
MSASLRVSAILLLLVIAAAQCAAPSDNPQPGPAERDERTSGQVVVSWLLADPAQPYWLEEELAAWPQRAGDRDLGPRRIMRGVAGAPPEIIYAPGDPDRLTAAVVHDRESWSAVGVDGERRPFLVRGRGHALLPRIVLDDPALAGDRASWNGDTPPTALRVGLLSEDSVRIAGTAEEVVVSLLSEDSAVLAYRFRWDGAQLVRGARTLVSPAMAEAPYLPDSPSYDNFDAVVNAFSARLAVTGSGVAYVAMALTYQRMLRHNAVFGTSYQPLRSDQDRLNRPSDLLITRIERDGTRAWSRLAGTPDVDDEVYALATDAAERVAAVGRSRRERMRDNTEWHATITALDASGGVTAAVVFDTADSGIAQCAAFAPDGTLLVGGTEGWLQNPSGISLYQPGRPFLLRLGVDGARGPIEPVRQGALLPRTEGHSELLALAVTEDLLWLGGLERGPLTHTGDADRSLVRADGWLSVTGRAR